MDRQQEGGDGAGAAGGLGLRRWLLFFAVAILLNVAAAWPLLAFVR